MEGINEQEKVEIQRQAKQILDNFSKVLAKVQIKKKEFKKETGGFREEKGASVCDEDFRKRMFDNAPLKSGDSIIAERKSW